MLQGTLYALGHGLVVTVLGIIAIVAAEFLPDWIDPVMERIVENVDRSAEVEAVTAGAKRTKADDNQWEWALPRLMLVLAVPAMAQGARGGEEGQL